jgi:predicted MPP superfamily phosphohydrolase
MVAIPSSCPRFFYGMYQGKYNFKVLKYVLHFEDLPLEGFDGYSITQISDIHSGVLITEPNRMQSIWCAREMSSDAILFTG